MNCIANVGNEAIEITLIKPRVVEDYESITGIPVELGDTYFTNYDGEAVSEIEANKIAADSSDNLKEYKDVMKDLTHVLREEDCEVKDYSDYEDM